MSPHENTFLLRRETNPGVSMCQYNLLTSPGLNFIVAEIKKTMDETHENKEGRGRLRCRVLGVNINMPKGMKIVSLAVSTAKNVHRAALHFKRI